MIGPTEALPADEVHVWLASRGGADDAAVDAARAILAPDELRRADRFVLDRDRRQFALTRATLRQILGRYVGRDPASLRFTCNPHGKPDLDPGLGLDPALRFNISHSGDWALFALARGRDLGVDVEQVRPDFGGLALAERFFAPEEVAALRALPGGDRTLAFFHGWTRKEAYIKARGKGLALPLDGFVVELAPGRPAALLLTRDDPAEADRWELVALPGEPGHVAAVCVAGRGWTLRYRRWPEDAP